MRAVSSAESQKVDGIFPLESSRLEHRMGSFERPDKRLIHCLLEYVGTYDVEEECS